ncbi:MAG: OmpH family outer membrane protein [Victivallales bacterium]|nr:OmpH family outer membrane protein [Victivallales bacterium]
MKRLALVLSVLTCGFLFGQDKVAYISMDKAWNEFYKTCNANVIFEQKKQEFEEKMAILQQGLEAEAKELKALQADATNELLSTDASEEAKRKFRVRAELFGSKRDDFERTRRSGVQELNQLKAETEEMLMKELTASVEKFASDKGITHLYDISGLTMNRLPVLLVYPKEQEVTDDFIAVINAGHDRELQDSKAKLEEIKKKESK